MTPDLLIPIITSAAWLFLAGASLASFRLQGGQIIKMALAWVVIFLGLYVVVEWYLFAQGSASVLV